MVQFLMLITNLALVFKISQCLVSYGLKTIFRLIKDIIIRKRRNIMAAQENESPFKTLSFSFRTASNGFLLMIQREFEISRNGQKADFHFQLTGYCRPVHKSIYKVKEHKIVCRKLFFPKKTRYMQRSVFGVEKSTIGLRQW